MDESLNVEKLSKLPSRSRRGLSAVFALLSLFTPSLHAETRLAILGDLEHNRPEMDCLTECLSKEPGVQLVERAEIDRLLTERQLSLSKMSLNEAVTAGALLGSQGVIIVKSFPWEGREILSARLVSSSSGAVLDVWLQDSPSREANRFADAVRLKFVPLLPKLNIPPKDAVTLSLLGIRSPADTPEGRALELKITLLLSLRLMREDSLIVLERWRLGSLAWEKALNLDEEGLATGNYAIDGSIESIKDGSGKVDVHLRLRQAGRTPETIDASGSTLDLKALANDLAAAIGASVKATSQNPAKNWEAGSEATLYANEAKWLLKAKAYDRAREAADAASALGSIDVELQFVRINALLHESGIEMAPSAGKASIAAKAKLDAAKLAMAFDVYIKFLEAGPSSLPGTFTIQTDWRQLGTKLILAAAVAIPNPGRKGEETKELLRQQSLRSAALTMEKGDDAWSIMKFYTAYAANLQAIFGKGRTADSELERLLSREFTEHPQLRSTIREAILNGNEDWRDYSARLRFSNSQQDQVDSLILSRSCDSAEAERMAWAKRDSILDGSDAKGLCAGLLIDRISPQAPFIAKMLRHAWAKDIPYDDMNFFMDYVSNNAKELICVPEYKDLASELRSHHTKMLPFITGNLLWDGGLSNTMAYLCVDSADIFEAKAGKIAPPHLAASLLFDAGMRNETKSFRMEKAGWMDGMIALRSYDGTLLLVNPENGMPELHTNPYEVGPMLFNGGKVFAGSASSPKIRWKEHCSQKWNEINDLPFQSPIAALAVAGGKLHVGFGPQDLRDGAQIASGVLQMDLENGSSRLLASSLRNPPLSPLDNCPSYFIKDLAATKNGTLALHIVTPSGCAIWKADAIKGAWARITGNVEKDAYDRQTGYDGILFSSVYESKFIAIDDNGQVNIKRWSERVPEFTWSKAGFKSIAPAIFESPAGLMTISQCEGGVYGVLGSFQGVRLQGAFQLDSPCGLPYFNKRYWFGMDGRGELFYASNQNGDGAACIVKLSGDEMKSVVLKDMAARFTMQFDGDSETVMIEGFPQNGAVHYTLDGQEPSIESPTYGRPFKINATTLVKARMVFNDGSLGPVVAKTIRFTGKPEFPALKETEENLEAGARLQVFKGVWNRMAGHGFWEDRPDFAQLKPITSDIATKIETIPLTHCDGAAYKFDFILKVKTKGRHSFWTGGNLLRVLMKVDGHCISKPTETIAIKDKLIGVADLKEGFHRVELAIISDNPAEINTLRHAWPGSKGKWPIPEDEIFHGK